MKTKIVLATVSLLAVWCGPLAGQPKPGTVLWKYDSGTWIQSAPTLGADGAVYISVLGLCAVTNSGSTASSKWTLFQGPSGSGVPAVGGDGTIYMVDRVGELCAINPDGSQKWIFTGNGGSGGSPAIGADGTIYYQGYGGLYAITPSGTVKWKMPPGDSQNAPASSPVVGADGTIYVMSLEFAQLYAFKADGTQKWVLGLKQSGSDSPVLGAAGTIYYAGGYLYAVAPDGTKLWSADGGFTASPQFNGPPVVGKDGTIYVTSAHVLFAFSPDGQLSWSWSELGGSALVGITAPAIDAGGTVYYCVSNCVWALKPPGQVLWKLTQPGDPGPSGDFALTSPTIGPDGILYAALGSTLYAIATGTNGPANSPWPMYRQNARHTGKVERPALKQPQKRSDANFQFQLYGDIGQTYTVESSTNLSLWTSLTSFVATTLPMDVVDLSATNFPARFYRATSPP